MSLLKKFTTIILLFLGFNFYSQTVVTYQSVRVNVPDPIVTEKRFENFQHYMNLAREEFIKGDYDMTFYYLKTAERSGIHSSLFWYYLGISVHHRGNNRAAKRYLKRGFYKWGCLECRDVYEQLFDETLKF
jgi:hypothetical protein